jgi:DNA-binding response OmpR family regulator
MSNKKSCLKGKKILAVDNEKDVLEKIKKVLAMADVDNALDYKIASEKISQNNYDLVIIEIMGDKSLSLLEKAVEKMIPAVMLTSDPMNYKKLMLSIRKGAISFLPKERLAELDRLLDMLLAVYHSGKPTWDTLFDELGDYFYKKFGPPMDTVEWICRLIKRKERSMIYHYNNFFKKNTANILQKAS